MNKDKKGILDEALYDNYEKVAEEQGEIYGIIQNSFALDSYIKKGNKNGFTRVNDVRSIISDNFTREELAEYFAEYLYDMALTETTEVEEEREVFFKIGMQVVFGTEKEDILRNIADCMLGKVDSAYGIDSRGMMDIVSRAYKEREFQKIEQDLKDLADEVAKYLNPEYKVENLEVNAAAINYCREEVLNGTQISIQNDIKRRDPSRRPRREYNIDDVMMAVTDIGHNRSEQQDAVSILYHPSSKAYKMLVVADGMGGVENGDKASQEITKEMTIWFEQLDPEYLKAGNEDELRLMWGQKLQEINKKIVSLYPNSGSTFVGAIVGEEKTVIASVGDSRAYALANNNKLYQITSDDNVQFEQWEEAWKSAGYNTNLVGESSEEIMKQKDELRFHRDSNIITGGVGVSLNTTIHFKRLSNDSYKTLMLFSDGVTDCLSDSQLVSITKNTDPKDLASTIVNKALETDSKRENFADFDNYRTYIFGGKDNTTAAVYQNTKEEER